MKTENIEAMLHYLEKSGISTSNTTFAHYSENSIILKRKHANKTTYTFNEIAVKLDENENTVLIKDENIYEYISLKNTKDSYIYNLQTLIMYRVLNNKLNVSTMSISQKVKDKKEIVNFNSINDFTDKDKLKILENKANRLITNEASYDIPNGYRITDGIPEIDNKKVIIKK